MSSRLIYDCLQPGVQKALLHKEEVLDWAKKRDFDVLVFLGAGDLDASVPQVKELLEKRLKP